MAKNELNRQQETHLSRHDRRVIIRGGNRKLSRANNIPTSDADAQRTLYDAFVDSLAPKFPEMRWHKNKGASPRRR